MSDETYTKIHHKADVTEELEAMIADVAVGWPDASVSDVIERIESYRLNDGTHPDFGPKADSPAIRYARKIAREARA